MEIITELEERGQVFRTDMDDAACAMNPKKVGPDNDGQPGGCDNVRITISGSMIQPEYFHGSEPSRHAAGNCQAGLWSKSTVSRFLVH
jgi:hypothetical protein